MYQFEAVDKDEGLNGTVRQVISVIFVFILFCDWLLGLFRVNTPEYLFNSLQFYIHWLLRFQDLKNAEKLTLDL